METVDVTLEKTLSIWWSLIWRTTLVSMVGGAILGGLGGAVVGAAGHPEAGAAVGGILGWLTSIPASMWALHAALRKKHGGCAVVLLKSA